MLKRTCKSIFAVFLAALLLCSLSLTAFAAETTVDFNQIGSITLTLRSGSGSHQAIPGGRFTLYHVADAESLNGALTFSFTDEFANCGVTLDDLSDSSLAEHLAAYAKTNDIAGTENKADGNGKVVFDDLSVGLYLIVQNGSVSGWYPISPFIVSIPMTNAEGTGWIYDVDASPKAETRPESPDVDDTKVTVKKIWSGSGNDHPASVTVNLLRDGEVYDTVTLSSENNWKHTWNNLDDDYRWSVVEADVPDGYTVSYSTSGTTIIIENFKEPDIPDNPESLTVKKVWKNDDGEDRPNQVTVELWSGSTLYDTVVLSRENGWSYTWTNLPERSDWRIREINIPSGYDVSYSVDGTIITIKNTATTDIPDEPVPENPGPGTPPLIQTGQLNWPIPVLAGLGVLLLLVGFALVNTKRKPHEK